MRSPLLVEMGSRRRVGRWWLIDGVSLWWRGKGVHLWWEYKLDSCPDWKDDPR